MGILIFLGIFVVIGLAAAFIAAPIRAVRAHAAGDEASGSGGGGDAHGRESSSSTAAREQLETAREAKYKEIRDAELDYRTGKLSQQDYAAIDGDLRAEALVVLNALELLDPPPGRSSAPEREQETEQEGILRPREP